MYKFKTQPKEIEGNEIMIVNIRFSDDCKNGHYDFSITADTYDRHKRRGEHRVFYDEKTWYHSSAGCQHELILKYFPEFKIFVDLHLRCVNGAPMYPVANSMYHRKDEKVFKSYVCTEDDTIIDTLMKARNRPQFLSAIITSGLLSQWRDQAKQGIKALAELIGEDADEMYQTAVNCDTERDLIDGKSSSELGHFWYTYNSLQKLINDDTFTGDEFNDLILIF